MVGPHHDVLKEFRTFSPEVLACVGTLRGALLDRCIDIPLERKPPDTRLASAREKAVIAAAASLRERCEAYALQCRERLLQGYEKEPDEGYWPQLSDREQELFGPLLLHAPMAGLEEPALETALAFSRRKVNLQSQERDFALAEELCEVLQEWPDDRFSPA